MILGILLEVFGYLLALLVLYNLYSYIQHVLTLGNYPPGPIPWPIIGNLLLMFKEKPYDSVFGDLSKKYGNVFSLSFGMKRMVFVQSIEAAREALITRGVDFAGRDITNPMMKLISRDFKGIAFADYGPEWKKARKLGHAGIKAFGEGMEKLESRIVKESKALHQRLEKFDGKSVDFLRDLELTLLNILSNILFGEEYTIDDAEFQTIIDFTQMTVDSLSDDPSAIFPILQYLPNKNMKTIQKCVNLRDPFLRKKLTEHRANPNRDHKGLIDSLILLQKQGKIVGDDKTFEASDDQLEMIIFDLLAAGAETTVFTFRWLLVYLVHHQECQEKAYAEMSKILSRGSKPTLSDRHNLAYTHSIIQETLRMSSAAPFGLPHKSITDSHIGGHKIPKGTDVIFNLWNMHYDERHWDEPNMFKPERWLDEDGQFVPGKHPSFFAFSAGRRVCIGESLAKTELFILSSRMIYDFKILPDPDGRLPSINPNPKLSGLTLIPDHFNVTFEKRH